MKKNKIRSGRFWIIYNLISNSKELQSLIIVLCCFILMLIIGLGCLIFNE